MKRIALLTTALIIAISTPALYAAEHGHAGHDMGKHEDSKANIASVQTISGVKAVFKVQTMAEAMKAMGMEMPKGVKETHHVSVTFYDAKSGTVITEGEVKLKVQSPDKTAVTKDLMAMHGHFGADFVMSEKGKYGIMGKFKVKDRKVRQVKFWYVVK